MIRFARFSLRTYNTARQGASGLRKVALGVSITVSASLGIVANAHQTPANHWCPHADADVQVVGHFDFSGSQMRVFANQCVDLPGSCGSVDHTDDYMMAMKIAENYCAGQTPLSQAALPILAGPEAALADHHHQTYVLSTGLYGACVVCIENNSTL
jgi:hypothetical protein